MKIVTYWHDYKSRKNKLGQIHVDNGKYTRLAMALRESILHNVTGITEDDLIMIHEDPPSLASGKNHTFVSNTVKLEHWLRVMEEQPDGEEMVFMDADMIVNKCFRHVFDTDFDLCVTKRNKPTLPYNLGIMFLRNNENGKKFMRHFKEVNDMLFNDYKKHAPYRARYGGMNQASFGYILENTMKKLNIKMHEIPNRIYNACVEDWSSVGAHTVVLHVKSKLRRIVTGAQSPDSRWTVAVRMWYKYDCMARGVPVSEKYIYQGSPRNSKGRPVRTYSRKRDGKLQFAGA